MGFSRQEYWSGVPLPSPRPGHSQTQRVFQRKRSQGGERGETPGEWGVPETEEGKIQEEIGKSLLGPPLQPVRPRGSSASAIIPKSQVPPLTSKHPPFPTESRERQGLPGPGFGGRGGGGRAGRTAGNHQEENTPPRSKSQALEQNKLFRKRGGAGCGWTLGFEAAHCAVGVLIQLRGVISPAVWTQPWVPTVTSWIPCWSGLGPRSGLRPQQPHRAGPCILISERLFHQHSAPPSCSQQSSVALCHQAPLGPPPS